MTNTHSSFPHFDRVYVHTRKQRRKVIDGPYAGLTTSYIARVISAPRKDTQRLLDKWFGRAEYAGREGEEHVIGLFICTEITKKLFKNSTHLGS